MRLERPWVVCWADQKVARKARWKAQPAAAVWAVSTAHLTVGYWVCCSAERSANLWGSLLGFYWDERSVVLRAERSVVTMAGSTAAWTAPTKVARRADCSAIPLAELWADWRVQNWDKSLAPYWADMWAAMWGARTVDRRAAR